MFQFTHHCLLWVVGRTQFQSIRGINLSKWENKRHIKTFNRKLSKLFRKTDKYSSKMHFPCSAIFINVQTNRFIRWCMYAAVVASHVWMRLVYRLQLFSYSPLPLSFIPLATACYGSINLVRC